MLTKCSTNHTTFKLLKKYLALHKVSTIFLIYQSKSEKIKQNTSI